VLSSCRWRRCIARFVALARHGYDDGNRFFRVRPGRWVQFGVNFDPAIAQAWRSQTIADDPFVQSNTRGTVSFAFARAQRPDHTGFREYHRQIRHPR
jgi:cyclophilin family peptidyl-prolyl cis-trans isomerase